MKIGFRHGIVRHQVAGGVADFLKWNGADVAIHASNGPLYVNFSHKDQNYLQHELNTIYNAWVGPFDTNTVYWLWMDINPLTGVRTFISTTKGFVASNTAPSSPVLGDHWYDLINTVMKEFTGNRWVEKIRLVIGTVQLGRQLKSFNGSNTYTGSQVGLNTSVMSGSVLLDNNDKPILRHNNTFVTTESLTATTVATTSQVKLASTGFYGFAGQPMSSHTLVELRDNGRLFPTTKTGLNTLLCGVIEQDVTTGEVVRVSGEGTYSKDTWNWSAPSVPLYVDDATGTLTENPSVGSTKVGYAIDSTTALVNLSSGASVESGATGQKGNVGAKGDPGEATAITLDNPAPTPVAIGGIPAGTNFDGVPVNDVLNMLLYPYQAPAFTSFAITGFTNTEVGASFTATSRSVSWAITNSVNATPNSVSIYNVTDNLNVTSGLSLNSPALVAFPTTSSTVATSKVWRITGTNTNSQAFTRDLTVAWNWAVYYGESVSTTLTGIEVAALRVKNLSNTANGTATFVGGGYKYYAYPVSMGVRTTFKDSSTNLDVSMEAPTTVSVTNQYGIATNYYVHRSTNVLGGAITVVVS